MNNSKAQAKPNQTTKKAKKPDDATDTCGCTIF